jgi:hypothetical protein
MAKGRRLLVLIVAVGANGFKITLVTGNAAFHVIERLYSVQPPAYRIHPTCAVVLGKYLVGGMAITAKLNILVAGGAVDGTGLRIERVGELVVQWM